MKIQQTVWFIMSKDRTFVAKGTPRNRHLVRWDDPKDKKRFLTYTTKGKAESGFKVSGFYGMGSINGFKYGDDLSNYLEPVEVVITMEFK